MVKIDKSRFNDNPNVQRLEQAAPPLVWNGEKPFPWKVSINGRGVDIKKVLLPLLLEVTNRHCAFCDTHPLTPDFHPISIEHFEPKSKRPEKAYSWENLFPACDGCTRNKGDRFDEKLLKPDDDSYSFDAHFRISGEGWLECKQKQKKSRASITIDIYKLNRGALVSERKKYIRDFPKLNPENPNDYPFRYLIPYVCTGTSIDNIINRYIQ